MQCDAGGSTDLDLQAIFEQQLGFGPRAAGPMGGGGAAAPQASLGRTIQLLTAGLVGFIFLVVGAYVAWVLHASLPH